MTTRFRPLMVGATSPISNADERLFFPGDGEGRETFFREVEGETMTEAGSGRGDVHHVGSCWTRLFRVEDMASYGLAVKQMGRSSVGCFDAITICIQRGRISQSVELKKAILEPAYMCGRNTGRSYPRRLFP